MARGKSGNPIACRRDANHDQVTGWYVQTGCIVLDLSQVGGGCPDLLIGCAGVTDLAEVKIEGEDLRPNQRTFNDKWRGSRPWKISTLDDVLAHVADLRRRARR